MRAWLCLFAILAAILIPSHNTATVAQTARRVVSVGVYQNKPKVFARDDGDKGGFFVDILADVAASEGWDLRYVPCEWAECLEMLSSGVIDIMPDVAWSVERSLKFDFHQTPVVESWSQLYSRPGVDIENLADLAGMKVAILEGSVQYDSLRQMVSGLGIKVDFLPTSDIDQAFVAVRSGRADVAVSNHFFGDYFYRSYGLKKTGVVFQPASVYFAVGKGRNADLQAAVERHIRAQRADAGSKYYESLRRWMNGSQPVATMPTWVYWMIAIFAGILVLAAIVTQMLRAQIRAKSEHLARVEDDLRAARRMETIGHLAGGIAHDFNNLLAAIMGYGGLMMRRGDLPDQVRNDLEQILKAGERAANLTHQLLAFGSKRTVQPRPVSVNSVVTGLEKLLGRLLTENIVVDVRLAPDAGTVMIDPGQLEQIVINLSVNARDAMPSGGTLTIETAARDLDGPKGDRESVVDAGRWVVLSVADTGIGMDEKTKNRIFEPFFTTKEAGRGTGLGLATVFAIMKQVGGHIGVQTSPGKGSRFEILLPAIESAAVEQIAGRDSIVPGTGTILVVEDDDEVRLVVERMLTQSGYRVLAAGDGNEAMAMCQTHSGEVDLVLTDVVMPVADGRRLADAMARRYPDKKILFMSGHADLDVASIPQLRVDGNFIAKPFTAGELTAKIGEIIGSVR